MDIKFSQNQGRGIYEQLQKIQQNSLSPKKEAKDKKASIDNKLPQTIEDKLDLSNISNISKELTISQEKQSDRSNSSSGEIQSSNGTNVSFKFDLFYSLSSKVEAKMGQSGAERFVSLGASVAETLKSSFSLQIDGVGSFMNGTEKSLQISPEVTNDFFNAIEGLTKQGPDALENFLKKSDAFFNELESTYGNLDGAFDTIKEQVQSQAKEFMTSVGEAKEFVMNGMQEDQQSILDQVSGQALENKEDKTGNNNLIKMFENPDFSVSQDDYKEFLNKFFEYANQLKQSMFDKLMSLKDKNQTEVTKPSDQIKSLLDISA